MSDNLPVTPGVGGTVATRDAGSGVQVQRVIPNTFIGGAATDVSSANPLPVVTLSTWSAIHVPAANTQATATKAAGGGTVRHVARSISVALVGGSSAPSAVNVVVNLIDGATAGTNYLWRQTLSLQAIAGATSVVHLTGLGMVGSQNTAMTLEFSAAGGANTIESVTLTGYDLPS